MRNFLLPSILALVFALGTEVLADEAQERVARPEKN